MTEILIRRDEPVPGLEVGDPWPAINDAVAEVGLEGITTTATTATFSGTPAAAEAAVRRAKDALAVTHGGRGHPVQSLHAVIRKFAAMPGPSVPTDAEAISEAKRADQRAANLKAELDRIAASTGVLVIREAYQDMPRHVVLCPSRSDVPVILAKLIPGATMSGMDQYDEADGPGGFADWFMAAPVN